MMQIVENEEEKERKKEKEKNKEIENLKAVVESLQKELALLKGSPMSTTSSVGIAQPSTSAEPQKRK